MCCLEHGPGRIALRRIYYLPVARTKPIRCGPENPRLDFYHHLGVPLDRPSVLGSAYYTPRADQARDL